MSGPVDDFVKDFEPTEAELWEIEDEDYGYDDGLTDIEADAMTLASGGWGYDDDYGLIGGDSDLWGEY